jgi:hypothetical protein
MNLDNILPGLRLQPSKMFVKNFVLVILHAGHLSAGTNLALLPGVGATYTSIWLA